jgi:hypothetical protein
MPRSLKQFSDQLDASGLLSRADVQALLESLAAERQPKDGEQLARLLVKQKQLTAYDADEAGGTHFLVMQYVEGTDLSARGRRLA